MSALTGVCGTGTDSSFWQDTCWFNGVRGDVLFGRERETGVAVGPFVDVTTAGFDDIRFGGGPAALFDAEGLLPLVVSAGGYARHSELGWEPGLAGSLFVGSRSYNFHSSYGLAFGLVTGLSYGLGDSHETMIVIALQIDGQILAVPFVAGYYWLRGPRDD